MNLKFNGAQHSINRFSRLGLLYVIALSVVACSLLVGQFLIQRHLRAQLTDSHVINVAGRQRMLSQRISKAALFLAPDQDSTARSKILVELSSALALWKLSQDGLLYGNDSLGLPGNNSETIVAMFNSTSAPFETMYASGREITETLRNNPQADYQTLKPNIVRIITSEAAFLSGMDRIVFQYDAEAHAKVRMLSRLEYTLLLISLVVIGLELVFVFRPTAKQVNKTINQLINSEQNARQLTKEIGALYGSLEKSYEQLSQVNEPVENPKLYAKADRGGNVTFIAENFSEMSGIRSIESDMRLCDLFPGSGLGDDWMDHAVEKVSDGRTIQTEVTFNGAENRETAVADRKSTRLNSSHVKISYAVFCLKKKIAK